MQVVRGEFHEKLQELRKRRGLTQEELAEHLYVSRTAISKWESGRGYPNIESLKVLARFFSITVDELISADEVLTLAQTAQMQAKKNFCNRMLGLLDVCMLLLLFLPLYVVRTEGTTTVVTLIASDGLRLYLRMAYWCLVIGTAATGGLTLTLQALRTSLWERGKVQVSLLWGACAVLLFTVSLQPYAAVFAFTLLAIKVLVLIKRP